MPPERSTALAVAGRAASLLASGAVFVLGAASAAAAMRRLPALRGAVDDAVALSRPPEESAADAAPCECCREADRPRPRPQTYEMTVSWTAATAPDVVAEWNLRVCEEHLESELAEARASTDRTVVYREL